MKGWLANHNEDSFAKAKQGQWALLCPQQKGQAGHWSCWNHSPAMPHPWAWELGDSYELRAFQLQSPALLTGVRIVILW